PRLPAKATRSPRPPPARRSKAGPPGRHRAGRGMASAALGDAAARRYPAQRLPPPAPVTPACRDQPRLRLASSRCITPPATATPTATTLMISVASALISGVTPSLTLE